MPWLSEIPSSPETYISAIRDYYEFLAAMYLDPADIEEPPEGGWPTITPSTYRLLGKSDEVISLLRHLPYLRPSKFGHVPQATARCRFANWRDEGEIVEQPKYAESLRVTTESASCYEFVPPHVIGLAQSSRNNPIFLLDVKLGIIHWVECLGEIRDAARQERIIDDAFDYTSDEEEASWRGDSATWAVNDFFEMLKDRFRTLEAVPIDGRNVFDIKDTAVEEAATMVSGIYRAHGWPDLRRYDKEACLQAIQVALKESFPDYVGYYLY
jgi:hypothetical protein